MHTLPRSPQITQYIFPLWSSGASYTHFNLPSKVAPLDWAWAWAPASIASSAALAIGSFFVVVAVVALAADDDDAAAVVLVALMVSALSLPLLVLDEGFFRDSESACSFCTSDSLYYHRCSCVCMFVWIETRRLWVREHW
jgi:hypothetical protein